MLMKLFNMINGDGIHTKFGLFRKENGIMNLRNL